MRRYWGDESTLETEGPQEYGSLAPNNLASLPQVLTLFAGSFRRRGSLHMPSSLGAHLLPGTAAQGLPLPLQQWTV